MPEHVPSSGLLGDGDEPRAVGRAVGRLPSAAVLEPGDHACWAVASDSEHEAVVSEYFEAGLRAGDRLAYFGVRYGEDHVRGYLSQLGADPHRLAQEGQLVVLDARAAYTPDGRFDPERTMATFRAETDRARRDGYRTLRAAGETEWLLSGLADLPAVTTYELRCDILTSGASTIGLCSYDARDCDAESLATVAAVHSARIGDVPVDFCLHAGVNDRLCLEGEVDTAGEDAFTAALAAAVAAGPDPLCIDVSQLDFIDVRGMRALADVARTARRVEITGSSELLRRCWVILEFDRLPNVVLN